MPPRRAHRVGSNRPGGFTLLEAVVALVILSSVIGSCLMLRSRAVAQAERIETRLERQRVAAQTLDMVLAGVMPITAQARGEGMARIVVWEGEHLGRPFVIERTTEQRRAPVVPRRGAGDDPSATRPSGNAPPAADLRVLVHRYRATCEGVTLTELRAAGGLE